MAADHQAGNIEVQIVEVDGRTVAGGGIVERVDPDGVDIVTTAVWRSGDGGNPDLRCPKVANSDSRRLDGLSQGVFVSHDQLTVVVGQADGAGVGDTFNCIHFPQVGTGGMMDTFPEVGRSASGGVVRRLAEENAVLAVRAVLEAEGTGKSRSIDQLKGKVLALGGAVAPFDVHLDPEITAESLVGLDVVPTLVPNHLAALDSQGGRGVQSGVAARLPVAEPGGEVVIKN